MNRYQSLSTLFFVLFCLFCMAYLATSIFKWPMGFRSGYTLHAQMSTVNGLYEDAPVRIGGVGVGKIAKINLNFENYQTNIDIHIFNENLKLPTDSQGTVYSEGLMGSKFLSIEPGFAKDFLKPGQSLEKCSPGVIIEELIAQAVSAFLK